MNSVVRGLSGITDLPQAKEKRPFVARNVLCDRRRELR
jgi:hypothetical protein